MLSIDSFIPASFNVVDAILFCLEIYVKHQQKLSLLDKRLHLLEKHSSTKVGVVGGWGICGV
jgi:hypothetical protein